MNTVDAIFIGLTFVSALIGFIRGLTREVLGLASWVGAGLLTLAGLSFAQLIARKYIQNPMMADLAAAAGLFALFLMLFSVISYMLSGFVRQSVLSGVDRSLGFGFGLGRGVIALCCFELLMSCFVTRSQQPNLFRTCRFAPLVYKGSDLIFNALPASAQRLIIHQQQRRHHEHDASPSRITSLANEGNALQSHVEKLARLQPKENTGTNNTQSHYTQQQKHELDRFLTLNDADEGDTVSNDATSTETVGDN